MKSQKAELPVSLNEELGDEIDCVVTYCIANDSIGHYEYWGAKLYDTRPDYIEVEEVVPIFTDETKEYRDDVEQYIEDNQKQIFEDCAMILESLIDNGDF